MLASAYEGNETAFSRLSPAAVSEIIGRRLRVKAVAAADALKAAEDDLRWLSGLNGFAVAVDDERYPPLLKEIYDPPFLLFGRGVGYLNQIPVAVVGTRLATGKAHRACFELCRYLSGAGVCVISGLAKGIDATAHTGALAGGGQTVAVLGSGIDSVYPVGNRRLAQRILENGGLILSEFPPGTEIRRYRFPQRNRIISGLAPLTIIVQAPEKSGALITADRALEQGRDVVVLAAGLEDVYGSGTIRLADQGAPVWENPTDIDSWLQRYEEVYGNERKNKGKEKDNSDYCRVSRQGTDY
ncbi:MAG: DNA-processing protein DprA [Spirochaetia bacterium]|nr:DNA-processing protein DprA [Spirochaetia bacterium]